MHGLKRTLHNFPNIVQPLHKVNEKMLPLKTIGCISVQNWLNQNQGIEVELVKLYTFFTCLIYR